MRENYNIQDTKFTKITTTTVSKENHEVGQKYTLADDLTVDHFELNFYP